MTKSLGVIFDMDGVLVDSYDAHFQSWQQAALEAGVEITPTRFAELFGRTSPEIIRETWGRSVTDAEIAEIDRRKEAAYRDLVERDFPVMPGSRELIAALRTAGFLLAVGSSGPPENVQLALERLQVTSDFAAKITGRDVTRGKPDPQVFLKAADALGLPPDCCAVIEDAPAGIEAANRAGTLSIGFVSTGHSREQLAAARHIVDSLDELNPTVLRELLETSIL